MAQFELVIVEAMVNLEHYPNPVRLFSKTRNTWFKELIESFGVPIHVFTNIRDTQLGQLFFAIEVMRMKKKRTGEDPGPSIFENESGEEFIPVFQTMNRRLLLPRPTPIHHFHRSHSG